MNKANSIPSASLCRWPTGSTRFFRWVKQQQKKASAPRRLVCRSSLLQSKKPRHCFEFKFLIWNSGGLVRFFNSHWGHTWHGARFNDNLLWVTLETLKEIVPKRSSQSEKLSFQILFTNAIQYQSIYFEWKSTQRWNNQKMYLESGGYLSLRISRVVAMRIINFPIIAFCFDMADFVSLCFYGLYCRGWDVWAFCAKCLF